MKRTDTGRQWRRDPDAKRDRVAVAARTLFRRNGYAATSTVAIAAKAGVSEALLFHYFGTKGGLLASVVQDYARAFSTAMFAGISPDEADLATVIRNIFAFVEKNGPLISLVAATGGEAAWPVHRSIVLPAAAERFSQWRDRGLIRDTDPEISAELVFGLVGAAITYCFVRPKVKRRDAWLRETIAAVEGALGVVR